MTPTTNLPGIRPCLIVAHADANYTAVTHRAFRRMGWDVYEARTGPEVRRLARMLQPDLVVLDTDLPEESGWLTCDKLTRELPDVKVVLVGVAPDARGKNMASFVGATALVASKAGMSSFLPEGSFAEALPVAG